MRTAVLINLHHFRDIPDHAQLRRRVVLPIGVVLACQRSELGSQSLPLGLTRLPGRHYSRCASEGQRYRDCFSRWRQLESVGLPVVMLHDRAQARQLHAAAPSHLRRDGLDNLVRHVDAPHLHRRCTTASLSFALSKRLGPWRFLLPFAFLPTLLLLLRLLYFRLPRGLRRACLLSVSSFATPPALSRKGPGTTAFWTVAPDCDAATAAAAAAAAAFAECSPPAPAAGPLHPFHLPLSLPRVPLPLLLRYVAPMAARSSGDSSVHSPSQFSSSSGPSSGSSRISFSTYDCTNLPAACPVLNVNGRVQEFFA